MKYKSMWKILCIGTLLTAVGCGQNDESDYQHQRSGTPMPTAPMDSPIPAPDHTAPDSKAKDLHPPVSETPSTTPDADRETPSEAETIPKPSGATVPSATEPVPDGDATTKPASPANTTDVEMDRTTFLTDAQKKLDTVNDNLIKFEKKLDEGAADLKQKYETDYKPLLIKKRDEAQALLTKIQIAGETEWKSMRASLQSALDELKTLYDKTVREMD